MIKIGEYTLKLINTLRPKKMVLKIGEEKDWKFGLITRGCYRVSKDMYTIHDFSNGWHIAEVNHETFEKLTEGKISLDTLNWE